MPSKATSRPKPTRKERKPKNKKKWTVMLYMAAAQDEQTELAAIRDIKELQRVGSTDTMDVIVQIDRKWPGYPQRYRIWEGVSELLPDDSLAKIKKMSTGDPAALRNLLLWSREWAPAYHYLLVLWGHAYGLGFGRDHGDQLTLGELSTELKEFGRKGQLDLLGANACAMTYAEAAYELRDAARFLVASEITMPFAGWPYAEILNEIVHDPDITSIDLGKKIVEHFMKSFERKDVALTLLDLSKAKGLPAGVKELAHALTEGIRSDGLRAQIGAAFLDTAHGDVRPLIDIVDLCKNLINASDKSAKDKSKAVKEKVKAVRDKAKALRGLIERRNFVVKHAADQGLEGLHGVGIFAPAVTGEADLIKLELSEDSYRGLELMKDKENPWPKFVYEDLRDVLDEEISEIADFVRGTGATTREDWTAVAQLLLSVKRSFANLESTRADVERSVKRVLKSATHDPGQKQKAGVGARTLRSNAGYLRLLELPEPPQDGDSKRVRKIKIKIENRVIQRRAAVAKSFRKLEHALAEAEKTARHVTTNRRFGLGEPFKAGGLGEPFKPGGLGEPFKAGGLGEPFKSGGLGEPFKLGGLGEPFKPGKLGEPFKPGRLGEPFKPGRLGTLPWLDIGETGGIASATETISIAELFRFIAASFYELEDTLATLETVALTDETFASSATNSNRQLRATDEVLQGFSVFKEMLVSVEHTALWVLTHPVYGLGPGETVPGGRQQLAAAAGLSPRYLRLIQQA
jgi:Clostripain family